MKLFGQAENMQLENKSSDYSAGPVGRIWWNTSTGKAMVDDGSNLRALLRNDGKAIIGSNGTANSNIRFHRGAASVLQFVKGGDTTAEGSLSTSIAQISGCIENYTNSGLPSAANAGRLAWVTDKSIVKVDTGAAWIAVGSGGGGGSLQWIEEDNAPTPDIENLARIYLFQASLGQTLYTVVKVPSSYVSGSPIKLRMPFYSNDTSGTALLQTVATLIRSGTDAVTSTTNQRTSTNSGVSLGGGTQNIPQEVLFDLTDTSGQVNSVAVSAADLLIVALSRDTGGTDTATSDLKALVYAAEVSFS